MRTTIVALDTASGTFSRYERNERGQPELTHRLRLDSWPVVRYGVHIGDVHHFRSNPDPSFAVAPPFEPGPRPTGPNAGAGTPRVPAAMAA